MFLTMRGDLVGVSWTFRIFAEAASCLARARPLERVVIGDTERFLGAAGVIGASFGKASEYVGDLGDCGLCEQLL